MNLRYNAIYSLTLWCLFLNQFCEAQCPTYDKRNNGAGTTGCYASDSPPYKTGSTTVRKEKSGQFDFTNSSTATTLLVDSIQLNGQLYQKGSSLYNSLGTIWFGNYNGSSKVICFYGDSQSDNAPPAGRWKFFFTSSTNSSDTRTCSYVLTSSGTLSSFDPGTISSSQVICSGSTPSSLSSTAAASGCTSPNTVSYQWKQSTDNATYTNVSSGGTSSTYSPGALTQTTYFLRVATCSDGASASTDAITITVLNAGTISPAAGTTWSGSTQTFSSNGTLGGTWSVVTSPASGVATIDASTGVLTNTLATNASGSGTVTYTVSSGGTSCTATRTFNLYNNSGTLPLTWETISAQKQNSQVLINWSTASEQNTKDFEVQYSTNTTNWDALATVQAAGNTTSTRNYSFTHQSPLKNNTYNYYRILQRDLDGKFSYSKIVSIVFDEPGPDFLVYPNPADKVATIYLSEASEVSLINSAGSVVWRSKLSAGRNQLPIEKFSAGIYFISTNTGTQRLVIL